MASWLLVAACGGSSGSAVECDRGEYPEEMQLDSQEEVESLAGYTSIAGQLSIDGNLDLRPLECLEIARRNIAIFGRGALGSDLSVGETIGSRA